MRDWQGKAQTMTIGKSFDTHGPLGPWLVTGDELGDPEDLAIRCYVDEELRQDARTSEMVFDCFQQVSHLSEAFTLEPGDVIATGTPAGVGLGRQPVRDNLLQVGQRCGSRSRGSATWSTPWSRSPTASSPAKRSNRDGIRTVLTERVESWREQGAIEEVAGRRLFVRRRGGGGEAPLLLYLHGFPSSSYDWRELLALRPRGEASICFDFLGFGLSEKPRDHTYTLAWQADAAEELVRRAGSPPVFLVGHDMGTSVATELMARDLRGELGFALRGALLFNGSMLLHLAKPTVGQRLLRGPLGPLFARLTSERTFGAQFGRIFSPAHPLSADEAADQWALLPTTAAGASRTRRSTTWPSANASPSAGTARCASGRGC